MATKTGRDARTGEFIMKEAQKNKRSSVTARTTSASRKIGRDAASGQFRAVHSAPKKGSLSLAVARESVAKVIESRKK